MRPMSMTKMTILRTVSNTSDDSSNAAPAWERLQLLLVEGRVFICLASRTNNMAEVNSSGAWLAIERETCKHGIHAKILDGNRQILGYRVDERNVDIDV